jgi:hypothetical protein
MPPWSKNVHGSRLPPVLIDAMGDEYGLHLQAGSSCGCGKTKLHTHHTRLDMHGQGVRDACATLRRAVAAAPCCTTLCHAVPRCGCAVLCHAVSRCGMLRHAVSSCVMPCMLCHSVPRCATLRHAAPCCVSLCTLCHAVPRCAALCHAVHAVPR